MNDSELTYYDHNVLRLTALAVEYIARQAVASMPFGFAPGLGLGWLAQYLDGAFVLAAKAKLQTISAKCPVMVAICTYTRR